VSTALATVAELRSLVPSGTVGVAQADPGPSDRAAGPLPDAASVTQTLSVTGAGSGCSLRLASYEVTRTTMDQSESSATVDVERQVLV
jgi:hypothetical protein